MRVTDELSLSLRSFRSRPKRTFLTIFGVSIGIGAVLFLVSLGYGLQSVIIGQITTEDSLLTLDVTTGSTELLPLDERATEEIAHLPNVSQVVRVRTFPGQIIANSLATETSLRAVDPDYFRLSGIEPASGHTFTIADHTDIVLSSASVQLLGLTPETALNKKVSLIVYQEVTDAQGNQTVNTLRGDHDFIVHGVIDDNAISYGYIPLTAMRDITPVTAYDSLKVRAASQEVADSLRDKIIGQGFVVSALSDVIDQALQIFRIIQIVLGGFGLIALFVSAIGMFNTMTITLLERTNEIGIMRSVGVTPGDIGRLFVVEAMLMGFMGGVMGIAVGFLTGELANVAFNFLAQQLGGQSVDLFSQPLWFLAVILGFSTLIGFFTGFFPARRAAKMDPLEALRYK